MKSGWGIGKGPSSFDMGSDLVIFLVHKKKNLEVQDMIGNLVIKFS